MCKKLKTSSFKDQPNEKSQNQNPVRIYTQTSGATGWMNSCLYLIGRPINPRSFKKGKPLCISAHVLVEREELVGTARYMQRSAMHREGERGGGGSEERQGEGSRWRANGLAVKRDTVIAWSPQFAPESRVLVFELALAPSPSRAVISARYSPRSALSCWLLASDYDRASIYEATSSK